MRAVDSLWKIEAKLKRPIVRPAQGELELNWLEPRSSEKSNKYTDRSSF